MAAVRSDSVIRMCLSGIPPLVADTIAGFVDKKVSVIEMKSVYYTEQLEKMDCYVVDAASFIARLDFFLPRKNHVLVFLPSGTLMSDYTLPVKTFSESDRLAYVLDTLAEIIPVSHSGDGNELSPREIEVLIEVASGKINKEIADKLNISVNTVISHRKNITSKLGIRSVSGLSVYALMNGLISS